MNAKLATFTILFAVSSVFAGIEPPWTNLVVNPSFELPALASGANHVVSKELLSPWGTVEDSFLVWASELPNEQGADGRQHVEVVSVWQIVPVVVGQDYKLSFAHSARPGVNSYLTITINGQGHRTFEELGESESGFRWKRHTTNFTATTSTVRIQFDGVGTAGNAHVDDVRIERLPLRSSIRVSEVEIVWETVADKFYQVQYRSELTSNLWTDLVSPIQGNGTTNRLKDAVSVEVPKRFYRVISP